LESFLIEKKKTEKKKMIMTKNIIYTFLKITSYREKERRKSDK
jgi:hypothetical protein